MTRSKRDNVALNQLVADCVLYNLNEKDALHYIASRFGKPLSARAYYLRKKNVDILNKANQLIDGFMETGHVLTFHRLMEAAQRQFSDTIYQLYREQSIEKRNENLILKLKADLREEGVYIMKLSDSAPIIRRFKQVYAENERSKNSLRNHKRQQEDRIPEVIQEPSY